MTDLLDGRRWAVLHDDCRKVLAGLTTADEVIEATMADSH